ncbi:hypothetical protein ACNKHN_04175 [Shigella flexneri]
MEPDQKRAGVPLLRHFPALAGPASGAHATSGAGWSPAQPTMETQDRVETENTGVKP